MGMPVWQQYTRGIVPLATTLSSQYGSHLSLPEEHLRGKFRYQLLASFFNRQNNQADNM